MLRQGSIFQIRSNRLQRTDGLLVIAMCHYPRGLSKSDRHEFSSKLAPSRELLKDFKVAEKKFGHNEAFAKCHYEERFELSDEAWAQLESYCEIAKERDVFLICQCEIKERCHREILLLLAQQKFGATVDKTFNEYPVVMKRLL